MNDRSIGNGSIINGAAQNNGPSDVKNETKKEFFGEILDYQKNWALESVKQTMNFSMGAVRACFVVNGMAAVALLAYLGNSASRNISVSHGQIFALLSFCSGCVWVIPCLFFAYMSQMNFTHAVETSFLQKYNNTKDHHSEEKFRWGMFYNCFAIIFGFFFGHFFCFWGNIVCCISMVKGVEDVCDGVFSFFYRLCHLDLVFWQILWQGN